MIIRYGEVLLNLAEALAELGTIQQSDIDRTIKPIRDRVSMPNLDMAAANANPDAYLAAQYKNVSGANKGVILEIRRERRVELVMENFRWNDLMRWKEGQQIAQPFKACISPVPASMTWMLMARWISGSIPVINPPNPGCIT
jgi:hypothetical protein